MMIRLLGVLSLGAIALGADEWKHKPVVDTANSPKAVLHGVPVSAVELGDGFWTSRRKVNVEISLPTLLQLFEEKGILDNFRRISGRKDVARRGPLFTDSDVYKWLEAVGFVLQSGDNPELRKSAEAVIDDVAAAQEPSGYLNTYYSRENLSQRHKNMRHGHEYYCFGHLIQAGIAWYRGTGDRKLLDVGQKMVDYTLGEFGPGRRPLFEGHPEIELALIELYRVTGDRRALDLAGYFLQGDPLNLPSLSARDQVYLFTGKPFTERTIMEGHAVRAAYACSGATDYYLETGEVAYRETLNRLWDDMTRRKQYITGGIGSRAVGETFGEPYELPNQQAYTESCASIATMFWNWRMTQHTPDSKYMDNFERALYNGANSGLSLGGNLYCYRNPLELTGNPNDKIRLPWYDTTCCPPNLQRMLASLPGYFYSTSKEGLYVHLFHNSTLNWRLEDGTSLRVQQVTQYPWQGKVELVVHPVEAREFNLSIRIPAWATGASLRVNGVAAAARTSKGYATIRRTWKPGDRVLVTLPMTPRLRESNLNVRENVGKAAVERGPLLYCMEGLDQQENTKVFDWMVNGAAPQWKTEWKADLLGGVMVVKAMGARTAKDPAAAPLYDAWKAGRGSLVAGEIMLIPYYTFANREPTTMQVWIPTLP